MGSLGFAPLVGQFVDPSARLEQLVQEAAVLDRRASRLEGDEERLAELRRRLDRDAESISAQAAELDEREEQLARKQAEVWRAWEEYAREKEQLEAEAERVAQVGDELTVREERFERRWRWLIDSVRWLRFRRRSSVQPCDVLFVPTQGGYRLLEQSGVAVAPGAVLSGLIEEHRRFEVTKITPMAFENRVCAYLQETSMMEGDGA